MTSSGLRVGILGATGVVGQVLMGVLEERCFPVRRLVPFASHGGGRTVSFYDSEIPVRGAEGARFEQLDLVFNAAGSEVSRKYLGTFRRRQVIMVDKSSAFRTVPGVPLVVPEINPEKLEGHPGIIASPNCSTTQLVMALHPINETAGVARVVVSTYQSASGAGRDFLLAWREQCDGDRGADVRRENRETPRPLARNVYPEIGEFSGTESEEEKKITEETRKILAIDDLHITSTAVRVSVEVGHAEAVWVETHRNASRSDIVGCLGEFPGVQVAEDPRGYATPREVEGTDDVFVGRIRAVPGTSREFWMWVVSDNLRKGAATNAVQIAEQMLARGLI